jgi:tRNA-2-methylthio-N6-dimethylallyladenosine synthase
MGGFRFFIKTFGCQMNKKDSDIIAAVLTEGGYVRATDEDMADVYVVNTCSVRKHAEQRALGFIASLKHWKKERRVIAVVGCMAQRLAHDIVTRFPFVDVICGPDSYRKIAEFVGDAAQGTRIVETEFTDETYCGIYATSTAVADFVSIMRGCNNYCSYCVVPYVRGQARSRPADDIHREIEALIHSGVRDITLLGQNVNEYTHEGVSFAGLLRSVARIPGVFRLRFLTSHPKDLNNEIISAVRDCDALCEWFHIPLQSGSNRILELMNRGYTREQYLELVARIRATVPDATVTTDLIAGFPGETEDEFLDTIDIMNTVRFDDAYLYRYSIRDGTQASQYRSLPERVVLRRLQEMIAVHGTIMAEKTQEMFGEEYEILVEAPAQNGAFRGKTRGNRDVVVYEQVHPGSVLTVKITDIKGRTAIGTPVTEVQGNEHN